MPVNVSISNNKIKKNTLGYLGIEFQYRLISAFFTNPKFFKDLYSIIDQNMFTEIYLKVIVGIMKDYYAKYDVTASYDVLMIKLRERALTEDDVQCYQEVVDRLRNTTSEGIEEIEELAEKFFKQQNWVRVANEIKRIAGDGDMDKYDECQKLMEEAISVGRKSEDASSPLDSIDEDLSPCKVVTIPTGIGKLDEALGGGLDKGKIGLIIGSSGFGKTSMTTGFSAHEATYRCEANNYKGFKVLQIVFEDTVRDLNRKYFSRLTQVETMHLNDNEEITSGVSKLLKSHPDYQTIKDNIRVMHLDTGEYSATDLRAIIKKMINEGFRPDVVIIDYFECLKPEAGTAALSLWEQEKKTMRKLENYAKELDIAIWLPTQGNRDSFNSEVVTMSQGGGAIAKQQVAQVVISIARTNEDIKNGRATIALLKNRSGRAGVVWQGVKFNNGTCTISSDDIMEFDDILSFTDHVEEEEETEKKKMVDSMRSSKRKYIS